MYHNYYLQKNQLNFTRLLKKCKIQRNFLKNTFLNAKIQSLDNKTFFKDYIRYKNQYILLFKLKICQFGITDQQ